MHAYVAGDENTYTFYDLDCRKMINGSDIMRSQDITVMEKADEKYNRVRVLLNVKHEQGYINIPPRGSEIYNVTNNFARGRYRTDNITSFITEYNATRGSYDAYTDTPRVSLYPVPNTEYVYDNHKDVKRYIKMQNFQPSN